MTAAQAGHAVEFLTVICAGLLGTAVIPLVVLIDKPLLCCFHGALLSFFLNIASAA